MQRMAVGTAAREVNRSETSQWTQCIAGPLLIDHIYWYTAANFQDPPELPSPPPQECRLRATNRCRCPSAPVPRRATHGVACGRRGRRRGAGRRRRRRADVPAQRAAHAVPRPGHHAHCRVGGRASFHKRRNPPQRSVIPYCTPHCEPALPDSSEGSQYDAQCEMTGRRGGVLPCETPPLHRPWPHACIVSRVLGYPRPPGTRRQCYLASILNRARFRAGFVNKSEPRAW